jgi:hypothetical protein
MFFPFEVADPHSGLHYRLNAARLGELSLAPRQSEWNPGKRIAEQPDPVWAGSLTSAPGETIAAVATALEDLILATGNLMPPSVEGLPDGRLRRHLTALVGLWLRMGDLLPDGLGAVRHVLDLPEGCFLDPLPVVEGSLDPTAPAAMRNLYQRLEREFGSVPARSKPELAPDGSRLRALQCGLTAPDMKAAPLDKTIRIHGLRDLDACVEFAAAWARSLIEDGCPASEIAVMTAADPLHLAGAFAAQGVPLSGLPGSIPVRDVTGETLLHLLLAKRSPAPAMVLASLALSTMMPWGSQTGRDIAEDVMAGNSGRKILEGHADQLALWDDLRSSAGSLPRLRFLLERISGQLVGGEALLARLAPIQHLLAGEGSPDWETILRAVPIDAPTAGESGRNREGVSLWPAEESPWRPCRHLIVTDFSEGRYPARPKGNPLFLDSELLALREATGLHLRGRAEDLARSLQLFEEQLRGTSGSVTLLVPRRDLAGSRLASSAGLALVARAISGVKDAGDLIVDLSRSEPEAWPVAHHIPDAWPDRPPLPEALRFDGFPLLALRRDEAGMVRPQSPSRLENLVVSPLAWLLEEIDARDMSWSAEELDVLIRGNIAHHVFEHVFLKDEPPPPDEKLTAAIVEAYANAMSRYAPFLRSPLWEMERRGLEREITRAAIGWRDRLLRIGARIVVNEVWLNGVAHGITLTGKADTVLELPGGNLLLVDHKKSGTKGRRQRMEAGWDLQAGLYRDMIMNPTRREGDGLDALIGKSVGVAYHLMNDGGLLTSGVSLQGDPEARDMGDEVNANIVAKLEERLSELKSGRVVLNTTTDVDFFRKQGRFEPYVLVEGSPLVTRFMRELGQS